MVKFGPLAPEIGLPVWDTPANFNGFRLLPSLMQRRRSPEANQTLHDVWPSPAAGVLCSDAANIAERKTWTYSEFCTWQNFARGQELPKLYI